MYNPGRSSLTIPDIVGLNLRCSRGHEEDARGHEAHHADHNRANQRRAEVGHLDATALDDRRQPEHNGVHDQSEQPERQQIERQRQEQKNGAQKSVEDSQDQREDHCR